MVIILMNSYEVYLSFQSCGRFMPGCGHAGQNIAIDPAFKGSLSGWCPRPLCILLLKSRHWRDALSSCLYRFLWVSVSTLHTISEVVTYWYLAREHPIWYVLQLWIVLLCSSFALQVIDQKVLQHWECKHSLNVLQAWREKPSLKQLLICGSSVLAYTQ